MKVTIVDIAKKLKVTPSTVSRALADNERVSIKTRELVKRTANEMGYQPNVIASSLRKGTSDTIGMVVPRINRHFFSNVIGGVEEVLNQAGYNLTIIQTSERFDNEVKAIDTLFNSRVAGIIISHSIETNDFEHLQRVSSQMPLVQFDRVNELLDGPKIINDNYKGSYIVTQNLIKKGCRKFIHLTGNDNAHIYKQRKNGFLDAIEEAKVPKLEVTIIDNALTRSSGFDAINDIVGKKEFDALVCAGDYAALGTIECLLKNNISIPSEVCVVGFGDEPFAELMSPSMSTVNQDGEEMGRIAAQSMLECIKDKKLNTTKVVPVKVEWRQSSNKEQF
ncbi:LacI family DNA-binding transcriptional regulator [Carboxylicivirga sp. M1479]|uniref:LacI family DNA-binding transcriptional regulator n=1 Tax=Carboxylicivirga sp. M1479 TaxID=2594476 RepID=UPI001178A50E|nr:LacI family DNA-binding transcriptional regulator [Carboxylicivirga sp. M1479]TRX70631.1 LacI family transcriptional regulator [Carboxylicivirga sp. M1479]